MVDTLEVNVENYLRISMANALAPIVQAQYPHQTKVIDSLFERGMTKPAMLEVLRKKGINRMTLYLCSYIVFKFQDGTE